MRRCSVGAMFSLLLMFAVLLWGPLSQSAVAEVGMTLGFAVDDSGLVASSEMAGEFASYLETQLLIPIKIRSFANEDQLYSWLTRFNEVDVAWLSEGFLDGVPAGQLYSLALNRDHSPDLLRGEFVSRQGVDLVFRQRLQDALLGMNENPSGRVLLSKLGVSRFVSRVLWRTPAWNELETAEPVADGFEPAEKQTGPHPAREETLLTTIQPDEAVSLEQKAYPAVAPVETVVVANPPALMEGRHRAAEINPAVSQKPPAAESLPITVPSPEAGTPVDSNSPVPTEGLPVEDPPTAAKEAPRLVVEQPDQPTPPEIPPPGQNQEAPIALVADSLEYNSKEDSYEAHGDVVLRQAGAELKADELLWQASTQDAAAQGSVRFSDADTEVFGDRLQYNMSTAQGQIHGGSVFVRDGNFHLAGEQIEKQSATDYFVENGSFTTCDGEVPDWKFSAREIDVTLGEYARAKGVWFHIKDIPVLYTPYLAFPVKTERESGLLAPRFGYSNNKGAFASMAWYQVIDRNMDATIYLDYLSEIGLGKGLEYRYALTGQNQGRALYYHVTGLGKIDDQDTKEDFPDLDYYRWEHSGNLPGGWRLTADIEYTDKKLFFEEFGDIAAEYTRDTTVSTLMLNRNWQKLNLVAYGRYIQDLETGSDDTIQRLPEIGLSQARYRLGDTPLYAGLESYATRFWSKEGDDGDRVFLKPSLSAVFKPGSWLEIVPEVALYERMYNANTEDEKSFLPEFSLSLGTKLLKTFDVDLLGFERIQHSVEPRVTYTYSPDESQDGLPLFDLLDRLEVNKNVLSYSLVNRLTSRSTAADGSRVYREFLNLRLSQLYDFDEEKQVPSNEDDHPFSPVRVELNFIPSSNLAFNAESQIPVHGDNGINSLTLGSTVNDGQGNALNINYTYRDLDFFGVATDYVGLQIDTSLMKPIYARFDERYDLYEKRELEKSLGLEYRAKCWSILLTYRIRNGFDGEDDDHEIGFTFILNGLGQNAAFGTQSVAGFRGGETL